MITREHPAAAEPLPPHVARLIETVRTLRQAQRVYFETRGGLAHCKRLEQEVDRLLRQLDETDRPGQAQLFG